MLDLSNLQTVFSAMVRVVEWVQIREYRRIVQ